MWGVGEERVAKARHKFHPATKCLTSTSRQREGRADIGKRGNKDREEGKEWRVEGGEEVWCGKVHTTVRRRFLRRIFSSRSLFIPKRFVRRMNVS